jgi:V8-like Glu-specific endopeptidase
MMPFLLSIFITFSSFALDWEKYSSAVGIILEKTSFRTVCSGVLIAEDVVLTAGHCLVDLKSATVITRSKITRTDFAGFTHRRYKTKSWAIHPLQGAQYYSDVDLGLLFLDEAVSKDVLYPLVSTGKVFTLNEELIRVGFGLRDKKNKRIDAKEKVLEIFPLKIISEDALGVGGDSGGPVYMDGDTPRLVAIHTGRGIDQNGRMLNTSHSQKLSSPSARQWLENQLKNYRVRFTTAR